MDQRRAFLLCFHRVERNGERLVFDLDEVAGILGDVAVLGDNGRDRLAVMAHLLSGDQVLDDRAGAERRQRRRPLRHVLARHDRDHARERRRLARVDADDARVRVRAAQDRRVRHARQLDVVDVAPLPAQEPRVLDAVEALAEPAPPGLRGLRGDPRPLRELLDRRHAFAAARIASTICW